MRTTLEGNRLTLFLEGRIDSNNAVSLEGEIMSALKASPGAAIAIDAEKLDYISSAGLRILMKLRKQAKKALPVENVSPEVYEIFEVTGFTELMDVQKRLREVSVEGCELIGSGGFGRVYRIDADTIVKVYNPGISIEMVQHERDTAQKAFLAGVPTAISYDVVKSGDSYGVVYELLNARTVAQIMDADRSRVVEMGQKSASLLRELHTIEMADGALPNRKQELLNWVPHIECILEPSEADELRAFIRSIPDRNTFLHGDFNSKNIMVQEDGEFVLIDIGDAAIGHPVFDIAELLLPYVFLTRAAYPAEEIHRLLGFDVEDAPKMWATMCGTYFGLSDPADIERMTGAIMPIGHLISSYMGTRRLGYDEALMRQRSLPGLRQRTLPLIRSAKPLDW